MTESQFEFGMRALACALILGVASLAGQAQALPSLRGAIISGSSSETDTAPEPEPAVETEAVAVPAFAPPLPVRKPSFGVSGTLASFAAAADTTTPSEPSPSIAAPVQRPQTAPVESEPSSVPFAPPTPKPIADIGTPVVTAVPSAEREAKFAQGVNAYDAGDFSAAYAAWKPLADDGDLAAQRNIAHLLRLGLGVEKDSEAALRYYEDAAQKGLAAAQVNLGLMHLNGEGTRPNAREAAEWFYKAARAGNPNGQFLLAQRLESGDGVDQDLTSARAYYAAAASGGHTDAVQALARLGPASDDAARMQTAQAVSRPAPPARPAPDPKPVASNLPRQGGKSLYGGTGLETRAQN